MDTTEQQKIEDRIKLLLNLTLANGCMPGEVEVAAYKIGSLIQKCNLLVTFPTEKTREQPHHTQRERARSSSSSLIFEYVEIVVIGGTEKALLCRSQDDESEFWIPRSQCRNGCQHWERGDEGMLYVSRWWAEKEGWT